MKHTSFTKKKKNKEEQSYEKLFKKTTCRTFRKRHTISIQYPSIYNGGGGNTTLLYQEGLLREGLYDKIIGYCTNNPTQWQSKIFEKDCSSPDSLKDIKDAFILICTPQPRYIREMKEQLNLLGMQHCLLEEAILKKHAGEVLDVYDMLYDQKSKDIYANILWCRLKGEYPDYDLITPNQYFCWTDFTNADTGHTFIDCGAYVGDSMEQYIWNKDGVVSKIICFEPDPNNFRAMQHRAERLRNEWNLSDKNIKLLPYGVSDQSSEGVVQGYAANNGLGSKISTENTTGGTNIKIVAIDDIIDDTIDEHIGFLKADIESYEYKMLLGAEKTIKKHNPCLAICIYHNAVDFYSVPLLVHQMMPYAKLAIRHHSNSLSETVLYAWT